jgi:hypothetical protein
MVSTNPVRESGGARTGTARALLCVALVLSAWLALAGAAHAADSSEFWPEANLFVTLSPKTRLFFDVPYTNGKESPNAALDLAAYLDVSLKPIRQKLRTEDWQRSRYLWARIGYDRIFNSTDDSGAEVVENRGIVSVYAKALLPDEVVMEARVRADLRWIGDDYSTRYRFRIEFNRQFTVRDYGVLPYFNVEWFYDTRYDGWARTLYQLGPEITVGPHFRYEIYLARQVDRLPKRSDLNALGLNFKWYY